MEIQHFPVSHNYEFQISINILVLIQYYKVKMKQDNVNSRLAHWDLDNTVLNRQLVRKQDFDIWIILTHLYDEESRLIKLTVL